jgi:hypothetical protein
LKIRKITVKDKGFSASQTTIAKIMGVSTHRGAITEKEELAPLADLH